MADEPAAEGGNTNNNDVDEELQKMMADLKLKKKAKKKKDEAGAGEGDASKGEGKGKKKRSKAEGEGEGEGVAKESKESADPASANAAAQEPAKKAQSKSEDEDEDEDDGDDDLDGAAARRKAKQKSAALAAAAANSGDGNDTGPFAKFGNFSYVEMLQLVYDKLRVNNPDLVLRKRATLPPPQVTPVGSSKINWVNFPEICKLMKRDPDHVFRFFLAELGTTGSIDGNGRFMIKGKYVQKTIESLLRKYVNGYVSCQSCRGVSTTLVKDTVTRMNFMHCSSCGASRAVAQIQKGYHATSQGERSRARNAE